MKIGILLSRVPYPLEKGDKLRAFQQIKQLSKNNELFVCALNTTKIHPDARREIEQYCQQLLIIDLPKITIPLQLLWGLIFKRLPLQVVYFFRKSAQKKILSFFLQNKVEHIYCQLIRTAEYLKGFNQIPKTIDYMDALSVGMERRIENSPLYLKPFVKIETKRLKRYEHFIFKEFDHHTIISKQDRDLIVHARNDEIRIIENGVDLDFFRPMDSAKEFDLIFTGNMSYPPNVTAANFLVNEVMPKVWEWNENLTIAIVGANPTNSVKQLSSEKVIVTAWVNDIREYYAKSKIFIAPMKLGTGLQNKLLEAMAMKIPCITTTLANNALKANPRETVIIADQIEDTVESVKELLVNKDLASTIANQAYEFVKGQFSWSRSVEKLEELFLETN